MLNTRNVGVFCIALIRMPVHSEIVRPCVSAGQCGVSMQFVLSGPHVYSCRRAAYPGLHYPNTLLNTEMGTLNSPRLHIPNCRRQSYLSVRKSFSARTSFSLDDSPAMSDSSIGSA